MIRLDRVVANNDWRNMFKDAIVHHVSMFASDHCMLALFLKKKHPPRSVKKRFLFKAMWTRDDKCRQIIEEAWDPHREDPEFMIQDRFKCCQDHLQRWSHDAFGNVIKILRVKQKHLQELKALNKLHETTEEIEALKKEINETLV